MNENILEIDGENFSSLKEADGQMSCMNRGVGYTVFYGVM